MRFLSAALLFYNVEILRVEFLSTVLWIDDVEDHGQKVRHISYIKGSLFGKEVEKRRSL